MTHPVVAELSRMLYGDAVDPVEFAKSLDAADVHIDGPLTAAKRKAKPGTTQLVPVPVKAVQAMVTPAPQKVMKSAAGSDPDKGRKTAAIGLGASGIAGVAGIHALTATRGENAVRRAAVAAGKYRVPKVLGRLTTSPKRAAAIAGAGLLGLHGVELVGDALAVHTQSNQLRKPKQPVTKGLVKVSLKPVNATAVKRPVSLRAVRPPKSASPVAKRGIIRHTRQAAASGAEAAKNAEEITRKVKVLIPKPRTAVLGGVALATGVGGASGLAAYEGTKRGVRRGMAKSFDAVVPITKAVEEKMQVFGWASVAVKDGRHVVDRQGDVIPVDELEKAAYDYVQDSRVGADQHRRIAKFWDFSTDLGPKKTATMIESMVFTPDKIEKMGLPIDFPQAWWVGYQIEDPAVWADIKSGKRTGFSIHGTGRRTPIGELETVGKADDKPDIRTRFRQAAHPPPVKRSPVESAAMRSLGYQPQTRKLDIEMRSRPQPYSYRVAQETADAVLKAPSKGKAYHEHIRNKAPHHTRYTVGDRVRLFRRPEQS